MFKFGVLTRWDFNFCVHSSPLRGHTKSIQYMYVHCDNVIRLAIVTTEDEGRIKKPTEKQGGRRGTDIDIDNGCPK